MGTLEATQSPPACPFPPLPTIQLIYRVHVWVSGGSMVHTHTNLNIISHTKNTCGKSCYPTTSIERVSLLRKHLSTRRISSDDTCTNYRTTSDTTSASPRHLQNKSNASGLDIWVGQILVINVIIEFNIHKVRVYTLYTTSTTKLIF